MPKDSTCCQFSILDDESFPDYFLYNAIIVIVDLIEEGCSDNVIDTYISLNKDGVVDAGLLAFPFLLWSKKQNAFYCFHFDTDKYDVTDDEFCEAYSELIDAYHLRAIMKKAKRIVMKRKDKVCMDFDGERARFNHMYSLPARTLDVD